MSGIPIEFTDAPGNSLPAWQECHLAIEQENYRIDMGMEIPEPVTALQRFIHEYDVADPNGSAWFMHRLELVIEEAKQEALRDK